MVFKPDNSMRDEVLYPSYFSAAILNLNHPSIVEVTHFPEDRSKFYLRELLILIELVYCPIKLLDTHIGWFNPYPIKPFGEVKDKGIIGIIVFNSHISVSPNHPVFL